MAPIQSTRAIDRLTAFLASRSTITPQRSAVERTANEVVARARVLVARDSTYTPTGAGTTPPGSIPNTFLFVLFGLIGAAFVITGIWFFFFAKNGGIHFKENDWEEYKSSVLRRTKKDGDSQTRGTRSTDLGGESIYKDYDNEESVVSEKKRRKKSKKKRFGWGAKSVTTGTTETTATTEVETAYDPGMPELDGSDDVVRAYRHEKPARVGGMNRQADGSDWDGSTNPSASTVDQASDLLSHSSYKPSEPPKYTPTRVRKHRSKEGSEVSSPGIRRVAGTVTESTTASSFWSSSTRDDEYIRTEARKLQEKGRAAQRRDFSFTAGTDDTISITDDRRRRREERREERRKSRSPTKRTGGYEVPPETDDGDLGTKTYHHVIPGLSTIASSTISNDYAEERRKKRNGGYRRARGHEGTDTEDVD